MAYSDYANMTGLEQLVTGLNTSTDGAYGIAIWGMFFTVMWVVITLSATRMGSQEPAKESFMASSTLMVFITLFMSVLGWVPVELTVVPAVLAVIGVIILTRKNQ